METALLELEELHYRYARQATPALCGATLRLEAGQRVALLGQNGSGKSTLLLHCNGVLRPQSGLVRLQGRQVGYDRAGLRALRSRVGLVFQNPDDQLFSASVAQDISFGPLNLGLPEAEVRQRVQQAAALCGLEGLLDRPTHALSSGQKTRAALAGVLAMGPLLLLADEVTASLDPAMRRQVFAIFDRLVRRGATVLLATHDLTVARRWADLVVVMEAGRVAAAAPPAQVLADRALMDRTGLDEPWLADEGQGAGGA